MSSAVVTAGLTRRFGRRTAVDHLDLDIAGGEVFGLVGPNGAGKTTLIRILCAILRPSAGSARVLGLDVAAHAARLRPLIGYMSQAFSLYQALTVTENLRFYGTLYGGVPARREQDVCRLVGLTADELARKVAELPTGVRQRAALAAAVLHGPQLIFLDEPTSGVDPAGRRDFWALIRELSADGTTVIVTTHVMAEAERCDRVALMAEGRVLACGPPASLRAATGTIVAVIEADPWQRAYAELAARWPGTTLRGTTIRVSLPAGADPRLLLAESLSTVRVERIHATDPAFEDAFIWFIRHSDQSWANAARRLSVRCWRAGSAVAAAGHEAGTSAVRRAGGLRCRRPGSRTSVPAAAGRFRTRSSSHGSPRRGRWRGARNTGRPSRAWPRRTRRARGCRRPAARLLPTRPAAPGPGGPAPPWS